MMKKYNFAILGAGHIAGIMAETISKMALEVTPYAIGSRDADRAAEMANKFGFEKSFASYEEMVKDENVDVVYIATPHSHHWEHATLSLSNGKHVLCEKAFTANAKQAREITALAQEKGLFLGEAVWTRYMPWVAKVREMLSGGVIGEVQAVQCGFGQTLTHVQRMVDPALAGGALLDLGIYPLTFATLILGTDVVKYTGEAVLSDRGVDAQNSITLTYGSGKMAFLSSTMRSWMPNTGVICGSAGHMILHNFWMCQRITVCVRGEEPYDVLCPFEISGYEYEVRAMLKAINEGRLFCDELPWNESLRMMDLMDGLRAMWGVKFPFE